MKKTLTLILILFAIIGYSQTVDLDKPTNYNTLDVNSLNINDYLYGGIQFDNYIYVDGTRTDSYTADGSITKPFKKIQTATEYINSDASTLATAGNYGESKYVLKITPGTYSDSVVFTNEKYLRVEMSGVIITGNVFIQTTQQTGDYYSKLEFWGGMSNRPEKGDNGEISGVISCTRNNDALQYLTFTGIEISNNLLFTENGTWVVFLNHAYFSNGSKFISGDFSGAGAPTVLLESVGLTRIKAHITDTDGSSTNIALYDCSETEFDLINTYSTFGGMLRNCTFKSDVTISAGTYKIDNLSYKEIVAQTENLTGATISFMDSYNGGDVDIVGNLTLGDTVFYDSDTVAGIIRLDSITGDIGNSTTGISVLYADTIYQSGVTIIRIKIAIDDDVTYNLPDASNINLEVTQAANFAKYIIITDGTVAMPITLNSTDDADTDGVTICVYDTGTQAVLKNRSGGTLTYIVHYEY